MSASGACWRLPPNSAGDTTLAAIEAVLDGAERQARAVIATWKDGVYHGEAILDDDGHGYTDIHIRATVTKRGSDLDVDLSDSHRAGRSVSSTPHTPTCVRRSRWRSPI